MTKEKPLYKNKNGFIINQRLGDIEYFGSVLRRIISQFALSDPPKLEEFQETTQIVLDHILSGPFDDAMGYPVYVNSSFRTSVIWEAREMIKLVKKDLEKGEYHKEAYANFHDDLEEDDWIREWDDKTR